MKIFNRLIKEGFSERKEYFWNFDGIQVPRIIPVGAKKIEALLDIERHHKQQLENNKSLPNVLEFKKLIRERFKGIKYIEEFPIPIKSEVWRDIYSSFDGRNKGTINKRWFSLDFYFPEYGRAIQLDSKVGHGTGENKVRDSAEDTYLWYLYGITTFRSSKLQFKDEIDKEIERITKEINSWEKLGEEINFDYSEQFIDFIYSYFNVELEFIERVLGRNLIYNEFTGEKLIGDGGTKVIISEKKLTSKDRSILNSNTVNAFIMGGIELPVKENIKYLFRILFKEDIIFEP
jgi:hypothetical protein